MAGLHEQKQKGVKTNELHWYALKQGKGFNKSQESFNLVTPELGPLRGRIRLRTGRDIGSGGSRSFGGGTNSHLGPVI